MPRTLIAVVCSLCLHAPIADADKLGWRLEKNEFIAYTAKAAPPKKGETRRTLPYERWVGFWYEMNATGQNWDIRQRAEIPLALALMLPNKTLRKGANLPLERTFEIIGMKNLEAKGRWKHKGPARFAGADGVALDLQVTFEETGGRSSSYTLLESHFKATIYVHPTRGYVLGAEVDSRFKLELQTTSQSKQVKRIYDEPYRFTLTVQRVESVTSGTLDTLINQAIDKGVKALKEKQQDTGEFRGMSSHKLGSSSLALLALLKSGVPASDPAIVKGFDFLATLKIDKTYDVACMLMAYDARYAPSASALRNMKPRDRKKAYADAIAKMTDADRKRMAEGVKWLVQNGNKGTWWYPHTGPQYQGRSYHDNSNTQYAVLGLYAAERCGIKAPISVWLDITNHFLGCQETGGKEVITKVRKGRYVRKVKARARGWNYQKATTTTSQPTAGYGSMTAGAVATMAICRDVLSRRRKLTRAMAGKTLVSMRDGLAWLETYYAVRTNPRNGSWIYYYLYALERAGIFTDTEFIGEHDWYREGAAVLVSWQDEKGLWRTEYQTAFALLFLRKASVPLMTTGKK